MKKFKYLLLFLAALCCICVAACEAEPKKLSTPKNLTIEGSVLTWDEVENATGYVVCVDKTEYEVQESRYDLSAYSEPATYLIEVMAVGDGAVYADSNWVEITYVPTPAPQEEPTAALKYTLLEDGSGYEVSRFAANLNAGLEGRVVIPDYYNGFPVKKISDWAFSLFALNTDPETGVGCNTVTTSVRLPAYLESIGDNAFSDCVALEEVEIPSTVVSIGDEAFACCLKLSQITLQEDSRLEHIGSAAFARTAISEMVMTDKITVIERGTYSNCKLLTELTIPENIKSIGDMAFVFCDSLVKVSIADSVEVIGNEAFQGCATLREFNLPNNLKTMGEDVFADTAWYQSQPDGYVTLRGDVLYRYKGEMAEGTQISSLPDNIKYIAGGAFQDCAGLTSIYLADGITCLGGNIFYRCTSLSYARMPADITAIPDYMFTSCKNLRSFVIPEGVTSIGKKAFQLTGLESISIPSNVKSIGSEAFCRCLSLERVDFSVGLVFIGYSAFQSCEALQSIVLPEGLTTLEYLAFSDCQSLKSVIIPSSVTTISEWAFYYCSSLESVVLPSTVTTIGHNAFSTCKMLSKIFYTGTKEQWSRTLIEEDNGVLKAENMYFYSQTEPSVVGNYWHYVDGEITCWFKDE